MGIMSRIESAMQGMVEGSFGRLFRTKLQPVELSRKLERIMEQNLSLGSDRRIAPNIYDLYLSPRDYAEFEPHLRTLSAQLSDGLIATARDRGYMLTTRPIVRMHEANDVVTGQSRATAQLLDAQTAAKEGIQSAESGLDETRSIGASESADLEAQLAASRAQSAGPIPPAWLTLIRPSRGQPVRLERQTIHVGRNLSNEIVVNDKKVSRFHAEIRCENGQFVLYDLGSTNGVKINGTLTRRAVPLRNNDTVMVGNHEYVFQRR